MLAQLARLYDVQTAYTDEEHRRVAASREALLAVLKSLGAPLGSLAEVPSALRERRQALWKRPLEPVAVTWEGQPASVQVRLPFSGAHARLTGHLRLETGEGQDLHWVGDDLPVLDAAEVEGVSYVVKGLPLPCLPMGYHRLVLEAPGVRGEALVIAAPLRAYSLPEGPACWGAGDFSNLRDLMGWVGRLGGRAVATLPLLAAFLDEPFEPSPYAPASRLLWNEFYLDVTRLPELRWCPEAQALLASPSFHAQLEALRSAPLVDYRRLMALKRQVLAPLARTFFAEVTQTPERSAPFRRFLAQNPHVEEYARFRATGERRGSPWRSWPAPLRDGVLKEGDYEEEARRYHLYVQWQAHQQVQALCQKDGQGPGLYLDLPLGVHPDGYDTWRYQGLFVPGVTAGAPPDAFFSQGQEWGFPPLHPERLRGEGYGYFIACVRHHLGHAAALRIDHVMGLHRLFWVPQGMEARHGVYVRYPAEEFYAILTLESQRNRASLVGEDLGTVPPQVRPAMARHGLHRMYVLQYETTPTARRAMRAVPAGAVASLNTHDMPPFAAFWGGQDIRLRRRLGLLDGARSRRDQARRRLLKQALVGSLERQGWLQGRATPQAVLQGCLGYLSASPASLVLVNLEDLWLEAQPQNLPGTRDQHPNWCRKARYPYEVFSRMPQVLALLDRITRLRRR